MTYNFATINENLKYGKHYGYDIPKDIPFDFGEFVDKRSAQIKVLNGAYESNWEKEGIELIKGTATFID
jgi:glutathione reductase (NADPH)